jgi:glycosyltransferase involved in cell wall biosynthesis
MKVLWVSNVLFPDVCKELKVETPVVGGWMYAGAKALLNENKELKLAVASAYNGDDLKIIDKFNITYYLFPKRAYSNKNKLEEYLKRIKDHFIPNLTHIHGTEYVHSLAYIKACGNENVVVSIQGMVSIYANYYFGGIAEKDILKNKTFRDVVRRDSLFTQQKKMEDRGQFEIELLQKVKHVIGRTSWDQSNVWAINSKIKYHFCNESLRPTFYTKQWKYKNCEAHRIFLSQAHYPIKGLQQMIKALPLVLKFYPNTKVYIAGNDFISVPRYKRNGFSAYIHKLMMKHQVKDHFVFLGMLKEEEMAAQYQKAHVFVCPSAIENSPNSVGEAQLIGTPCIASYVGGSMDMVQHNKSGYLYRFEETNMLSKRICELFKNKQKCIDFSEYERKVAINRHHPKNNALQLLAIYESII